MLHGPRSIGVYGLRLLPAYRDGGSQQFRLHSARRGSRRRFPGSRCPVQSSAPCRGGFGSGVGPASVSPEGSGFSRAAGAAGGDLPRPFAGFGRGTGFFPMTRACECRCAALQEDPEPFPHSGQGGAGAFRARKQRAHMPRGIEHLMLLQAAERRQRIGTLACNDAVRQHEAGRGGGTTTGPAAAPAHGGLPTPRPSPRSTGAPAPPAPRAVPAHFRRRSERRLRDRCRNRRRPSFLPSMPARTPRGSGTRQAAPSSPPPSAPNRDGRPLRQRQGRGSSGRPVFPPPPPAPGSRPALPECNKWPANASGPWRGPLPASVMSAPLSARGRSYGAGPPADCVVLVIRTLPQSAVAA